MIRIVRWLHLVAILSLIGSAAYAYSIKYDTLFQAERVAKAKGQIARQREAIAVLKAEWQHLNRPDRLQGAAEKHLDLQPLHIHQLARLSDLPNRPERGDEIGKMLGVLEGTATPKDKRADASARTPASPVSTTPKR